MELQNEQCRIELAAGEEEILFLKEERDWLLNLEQESADLKTEYAQNIRALEEKILAGESDVKIAYLTFDDGPYKQTEQYLAILDQYDIKATFFVIG
ncbi:MAG: polysaccharide deacetylase family protein, partial [Firmicutes bacterium]|nr:polysaccharide deacetylase family protein [Bacillota bacterium]